MAKKSRSMKWKMIGILLVCWMIPFSFLIAVLGVYVGNNHSDMTAENYRQQIEFNNRICVERLDSAVKASRQASYDGEILKTLENHQKGTLSYHAAQKEYKSYLTAKYQQNDLISGAILWFGEGVKSRSCSVYNEKVNGSYQQILDYWQQDHEAALELSQTLDTSVGFLEQNGRLYLIRNLLDNRFQVQCVLVFLLNKAYCLNTIASYPMQDGASLLLNDQEILETKEEKQGRWKELRTRMGEKNYCWERGRLCVGDTLKGDGFSLEAAVFLDENVTMFPFYGYQYVLGAMVLSLLPLLAAVLFVFRREVSDPVEQLSKGAAQIQKGELGSQIPDVSHNLEFSYLTNSFNEMSSHLKAQFDKIYQEEIALREARIMALQSHINPHFMNNTMEIINWEARMNGNEKVSKMIGALSNMMDAAMDRRKRPEVSLEEEMGYVNSYLYIMKERLGKRLEAQIDVPEELMKCSVPRLILQPLIENAIEHGVVPNGHGMVEIRAYKEEGYLCLETLNDGGLSPEDEERIRRLLNPGYNTSQEPEGNLGIANVNQRLRILFGESCGLIIEERADGRVAARIRVPLRKALGVGIGRFDGQQNTKQTK